MTESKVQAMGPAQAAGGNRRARLSCSGARLDTLVKTYENTDVRATGRPRKTAGAAATADRFSALADPTRRHLLEQLAGTDLAVCQLTAGLSISQAAVSQHLRVLREAGLVTCRRDGRNSYYRLRPAALTELRDWLDELELFWRARLAALGDYLEQAPA
jgi:DNA-binding transcriptional ArsR family regulator